LPNKLLQLTAGSSGSINVFGVAVGLGLSNGLRQNPAATEPGSLSPGISGGERFWVYGGDRTWKALDFMLDN
jgi:hypothetical protein